MLYLVEFTSKERERDSLIHDDNGPNRAVPAPPPSAAKGVSQNLKNIHPFTSWDAIAWHGVRVNDKVRVYIVMRSAM